MHRTLAGLLLLLACSPFALAQRGSAIGRLTVTATVVSSTLWIQQPDGSFRLVVANAYGGQDVADMQMAVNRPPAAPNVAEVAAVQLVSPNKVGARRRTHRR